MTQLKSPAGIKACLVSLHSHSVGTFSVVCVCVSLFIHCLSPDVIRALGGSSCHAVSQAMINTSRMEEEGERREEGGGISLSGTSVYLRKVS